MLEIQMNIGTRRLHKIHPLPSATCSSLVCPLQRKFRAVCKIKLLIILKMIPHSTQMAIQCLADQRYQWQICYENQNLRSSLPPAVSSAGSICVAIRMK